MITCACGCGKTFEKNKYNHKYYSRECANKYHPKYHKDHEALARARQLARKGLPPRGLTGEALAAYRRTWRGIHRLDAF